MVIKSVHKSLLMNSLVSFKTMTKFDLFKNRNAALITKHNKEKVIFPVLELLGMQLLVLNSFDTDRFGTFTRNIPREGSQLETARKKAKKAMEVTGASIALASEGSFGPHPQIFFVPANIELVLFMDAHNNIEIQGWEILTKL